MEPDIKEGSLIFVDKSKADIKTIDTYVIRVKNEIYIKVIKKEKDNILLKSINTNFDDIKVNIDEIKIIGRVCGVLVKAWNVKKD